MQRTTTLTLSYKKFYDHALLCNRLHDENNQRKEINEILEEIKGHIEKDLLTDKRAGKITVILEEY